MGRRRGVGHRPGGRSRRGRERGGDGEEEGEWAIDQVGGVGGGGRGEGRGRRRGSGPSTRWEE